MSESEELEVLVKHCIEGMRDAFAARRVLAKVAETSIIPGDAVQPLTAEVKVVVLEEGFPGDAVPTWVHIYPGGVYGLDLTNARLLSFETKAQFEIAVEEGLRKGQKIWRESHDLASQEQHPPARAQTELDAIDQQIVEITKDDVDITDSALGSQIHMTRQAVNTRRVRLKKLGYTVR